MAESFMFEKDGPAKHIGGSYHDPVLIKSSGFSSLYRLSRDGKYFLLKTVGAEREASEKMLVREYELSIGLDHPNIVSVFMLEPDTPVGPGMLMEYIDGRTLDEFLTENPSLRQRQKVFGQLLDAVAYLHKKGIVHNDLKPANIMVTNNGDNLKLIDFGLSDDDAHYMVRTPGCSWSFAAPELRENRVSDSRSDIYSAGMIMRLLFSKRYGRISRRCVEQLPEKRFADGEELKKSWQRRGNRAKYLSLATFGVLLVVAVAVYAVTISGLLEERDRQSEKVIELENTLTEQEENYQLLQENYVFLRDSLETSQKKAVVHQEAIERKMKELDDEIDRRYAFLCRERLVKDDIMLPVNYFNGVSEYFEKMDKVADGEDISDRLHSLMMIKLEKQSKELQQGIR